MNLNRQIQARAMCSRALLLTAAALASRPKLPLPQPAAACHGKRL